MCVCALNHSYWIMVKKEEEEKKTMILHILITFKAAHSLTKCHYVSVHWNNIHMQMI